VLPPLSLPIRRNGHDGDGDYVVDVYRLTWHVLEHLSNDLIDGTMAPQAGVQVDGKTSTLFCFC
jgi:hypothetical protein